MSVQYDVPNSCNKCGETTKHIDPYYESGALHETKTECLSCGFVDYWSMGFYESGKDMVGKCKKYSFK